MSLQLLPTFNNEYASITISIQFCNISVDQINLALVFYIPWYSKQVQTRMLQLDNYNDSYVHLMLNYELVSTTIVIITFT